MDKTLLYTIICIFSLLAFMLVVPLSETGVESENNPDHFGSFTASQRYIDTAGSSFHAANGSRNTFKLFTEVNNTNPIQSEIYTGSINFDINNSIAGFTLITGNILTLEILDLPPPSFFS